ncbi:S8 family peptidase [Paenibacillus filicis]|uniref:S8 family peptidase n=1 Tax=Paenibacillus filicis TaxID=669464 RepID=A0ABU9DEL0_9BACL
MNRPAGIHHKTGSRTPSPSGRLRRPPLLKGRRLIPIIVQFKRRIKPADLHALRKHVFPHTLTVHRHLRVINGMAARVSSRCLNRISEWKGVSSVYPDRMKRTTLHIATPAIGAVKVRKKLGLTGKGVNIAFLDTGVYRHPDLTSPRNRIVAFKDLINGRKHPYDDNGHGTHVAGDAAGNGILSKGKYSGPAPEAGVVAVKVLNQAGNGRDSTIIKGIEWCIANRKRLGLRILSLSLGGPVVAPCRKDPLCQSLEKAVRAGLVVVVAAGNSGPRKGSVESPGNSPSALTVGAVDDRRTVTQSDDVITWYSSRGPVPGGGRKPDLAAPGEGVVSLRAPGSLLDTGYPQLRVGRGYFTLSGTSMSTPLVAGAAAVLLEKNPSLTPAQVKKVLKRHAFPLHLGADTAGSGEINLRFMARRRRRHRKASGFGCCCHSPRSRRSQRGCGCGAKSKSSVRVPLQKRPWLRSAGLRTVRKTSR